MISLGGLLPLTNSSACASSWAHWYVATEAVSTVTSSSWWPRHLSLALEFIDSPATSPVDSILHEATFAGITSGPPRCAPASGESCTVSRVGMFSVGSSASNEGVDVAYAAPISMITAGARSVSLTNKRRGGGGGGAVLPTRRVPIFRLGANAEDVGGAIWEFLHSMGWQVADLLYMSTDVDSADTAAALIAHSNSEKNEHSGSESGDLLRIHRSWSLQTMHDVTDALDDIRLGEPRVVILLAPAPDAAVILLKAQGMGMYGKGWAWIGDQWVFDLAAKGGAAVSLSPDKIPSLGGLVGVSPPTPPFSSSSSTTSSSLVQRLSRIHTADIASASTSFDLKTVISRLNSPLGLGGVYPLVSPTFSSDICPSAFAPPFSLTGGIPLDAIASDTFDSIWHLASAAATCSPNTSIALTKGCVIETLGVDSRPSPLSGRAPSFSIMGEERGAPLALFNARVDGTLVIVGSWNGKSLDSHGTGEWSLTDKVQWPSGTNIIPSDRVGKVEKVLSIAFFIVLCGLILSALIATVVHRSGFTDTMPESLITIFVGLAIGAIVRVSSNMEVRDAASFSNEIFMLGLLPIIIAESGYSLDKAIFFKNFWSILVFAVFGTLISALTIGFFIFEAGKAGTVVTLSFDECMAYASLLSATDPVATLAVFGALRVDPTLNALVYGESVLNDAVGLVLFRVWATFIVEEVTGLSLLLASFRFLEILLASIFLGYAVGFVCTIVFRIMFKQTAHSSTAKSDVKETSNGHVHGRVETGLRRRSGDGLREEVNISRNIDSRDTDLAFVPRVIESLSRSAQGSTESLQDILHKEEEKKKEESDKKALTMIERSTIEVTLKNEVLQNQNRLGVIEGVASNAHGLSAGGVSHSRVGEGLRESLPLEVPPSPLAASLSLPSLSSFPDALGLASPPIKGRGVITFFVSGAAKMIRLGGEASYAHGENDKAYEGIDETVLLLLFLYVSFALTEALDYSGIVAALFCGISLSYYTRKIMSRAGKRMSTAVLRLLASLADTIVFLQVGMTVSLSVSVNSPSVGVLFIITLLGCLIGRALNIAPLSALVNLFRKQKIGLPIQAQMWWAGLRGAIAFASAASFPSQHRALLLDVTSWICLVTICVMGPTTPALLRKLKIPYNVQNEDEQQNDVEDEEPQEYVAPFIPTCNWADSAIIALDTLIRRVIYGKELYEAILLMDTARKERKEKRSNGEGGREDRVRGGGGGEASAMTWKSEREKRVKRLIGGGKGGGGGEGQVGGEEATVISWRSEVGRGGDEAMTPPPIRRSKLLSPSVPGEMMVE